MPDFKAIKGLVLLSQIGFYIIVPVVMMAVLGSLMERYFDFRYTLIFILLGLGAGIRNVFILITKEIKKLK